MSMMKMVVAIVNRMDTAATCKALNEAGFFFTQIGSIGGYLREGNSTLLIGTQSRNVPRLMDVIRENCEQRTERFTDFVDYDAADRSVRGKTIMAGGATVFVLDVDQFEKM